MACDRGGMDLTEPLGELIKGTEGKWFHLVKEYASRNLTKASDKLVAIAGLAETRRSLTGDEYYFGLWRSGVHQGLLWYCHAGNGQISRLPSEYGIPTWSWASMTGQVLWEG